MRFTHLELAAVAGLATLHPEGDGTLHGNVVGASGVRHVVGLPFAPDGAITVTGSVVAGAALAWRATVGGARRRRRARSEPAWT